MAALTNSVDPDKMQQNVSFLIYHRIYSISSESALIAIGPVKQFLSVKLGLFSYPSVLPCVLSAQKNRLIETVLLSTHNICFG